MKFRNHPNVTAMKNLNNGWRLNLCRVSVEEVFKEIKKLNTQKATQPTDLPVKRLNDNSDIFGNYICRQTKFPVNFKTCKHYTSFLKKMLLRFKRQLLTIRIFLVTSKIFEKLLCKQITLFIDPRLPKF